MNHQMTAGSDVCTVSLILHRKAEHNKKRLLQQCIIFMLWWWQMCCACMLMQISCTNVNVQCNCLIVTHIKTFCLKMFDAVIEDLCAGVSVRFYICSIINKSFTTEYVFLVRWHWIFRFDLKVMWLLCNTKCALCQSLFAVAMKKWISII